MSMSEAVLVEKARGWAEDLCHEERRGRADFVRAMQDVAKKLKLPFGFLKHLTYDNPHPKTISAGRFFKLAAAHDEYLQRQRYREERATFEPGSTLGRLVARTADHLAGEEGPTSTD